MSSTSTSEAAPAGRSASADATHGPPVQQFDANLRILTDSYLSFFQERKRIEEQYVDALQKLHKRIKTTDIYLDDKFESMMARNTTRMAWAELRDNVDRETESRQAFIASLSSEVINPLVALKETQERIRKRIREDLKEAISAHTDYAENVFPKLKRTYLKKSQDVEEFRNAAANAPPTSPTVVHEHNPFVLPKPGQSSGKPIVTAPQPLKPVERRSSTTGGPTRNRSPSTSTALQDLAHQGKRQLNQLMTFLDKGGNLKDNSRADNALRTVRAKRDADDADKEYRRGVHWLETLRLRRVKILEGGYNSLEQFVRELSETTKRVLERYCDSVLATAMTQAQMAEHAITYIEKISPEKDVSLLTSTIPRLLNLATPKPQYYQNYSVGECRDLIFGVSLVDYATAKGLADGEIPKIVRICIREIEQRGLEAEGIYRVSGRHASVQDLQHKIERDEDAFEFSSATDDVYAISSLLKLYLRELPEPLFKFPLQDRMQHTEDIEGHISNNFRLLRSKMRRLPPVHQATLKAIVEHLAKVASHSEKNKMDAKNLAIVFGTVIFGEDEIPKAGDLLSVQAWKDTLMEDLITHAHVLFQSSNSSPPLPPAPAGEPVPVLTYGSSHTKVHSEMRPPPLPPRDPSPNRRPKETAGQPAPPLTAPLLGPSPERPGRTSEDFTPKLPPRPTDSIHPSLRSGPMSSHPNRQSLPAPSRNAQWFDDTFTFNQVPPSNPPSVPPSPSRRLQRVPPSPLPLKSPWSESQPSLYSAQPSLNPSTSTNASSTSVDADPSGAQLVNVISLNDDGPLSAPSTSVSFTTAASPAPSIVSSTGRRTPVTPPPPSGKPLLPPGAAPAIAPGGSPGAASVSTMGSSRHRKGASSSSE